MIDTEIGESDINTFFSCLDLPSIHFSLLQRYETIVGRAIEETAAECCEKSLLQERREAIQYYERQAFYRRQIFCGS